MFYFLKWPSDSKLKVLGSALGGLFDGMKKRLLFGPIGMIIGGIFGGLDSSEKSFLNAKELAKICGKILAYMLVSSEYLRKFQMNLVGFSLGNHVIKHCIKELYRIKNYKKIVKLKNVIFIAGATQISNSLKWKNYINELITDRIINCYSKNDEALSIGYKFATKKGPIGLNELIIKDDNKNNMVENYQFSYGHLDYDYKGVAKEIFKNYKNI